MSTSTATRFDRSALLASAQQLLTKNNFTREDSSRVENLLRLAAAVDPANANLLRRMRVAELEGATGQRTEFTSVQPETESEFRDFLRHGKEALSPERRALNVSSGPQGGYLVPQSFIDRLENALRAYDQLFDAVSVLRVPNGNLQSIPILDDGLSEATVVGEGIAGAEAGFVLGAIGSDLPPFWRSGIVRCSLELAGDSHFDMGELLAAAFAVRFARGVGKSFVTTLSTATVGVTCASASAITADEVVDLVASLNSAYGANASFAMNLNTLSRIYKTKSSTGGAFMFPPAADAEGFPLLLSRRVYLCPNFPSVAANAVVAAFGDLSKFIRRQVNDSLAVQVSVERYAEYGQIAYEGFWRLDGLLSQVAGAPAPIVLLKMGA